MKNYLYLCTRVTNVRSMKYALVAELVDAPDLGSGGSGRVGSSPIRRTKSPLKSNKMAGLWGFPRRKRQNLSENALFF